MFDKGYRWGLYSSGEAVKPPDNEQRLPLNALFGFLLPLDILPVFVLLSLSVLLAHKKEDFNL
jgi:hypothetical protein